MHGLAIATCLPLLPLCGAAAWTDWRRGIISNWLTLPALLLGLSSAGIGGGWSGFIGAMGGALVASLVPLILFRLRAMGGGDVKLFAAMGAFAGGATVLEMQLLSFAVGSLAGVIIWMAQGRLREKAMGLATGARHMAKTELRFAPCIFTAVLAHLLWRLFGGVS